MARLFSAANGNNTDASTWYVIDNGSFNESETSTITLTTSYTGVSWTAFAPGAITIDGCGFRVAQRIGTTGTLSGELYNSTLASSVAGTEVTINLTDLADTSAASDGGWIFLKYAAPVTLLAGNNYQTRYRTSASSQLSIAGSTSTNPSRLLRTTASQAPIAGDDRYIYGEFVSGSGITTKTVILNDTGSAIDYGSASTSQVNAALSIGRGGTFTLENSASRNYVQKLSGNAIIYNGGVVNLGQTGSFLPSSSTFRWDFDCVSNVDFGIFVRRGGTFNAAGTPKTRWTTLTGNVSASMMQIPVVSTNGWQTNDTLVLAPTLTTITQAESRSISTVDSTTQVTITPSLSNTHHGIGSIQGEVGNLTSNLQIYGKSNTVGTFLTYNANSYGYINNVEFRYYGSSNTSKRGLEIQHLNTSTMGVVTVESCSFYDQSLSTSLIGANVSSTGDRFRIVGNVCYTTISAGSGFVVLGGGSNVSPIVDFSNNCAIGGTANAGTGIQSNIINTFQGNNSDNVSAGYSTGVTFSVAFIDSGHNSILSGYRSHSNSTGINVSGLSAKTILSSSFVSNSTGMQFSSAGPTNIVSCSFIGNAASGLSPSSPVAECILNNCEFKARLNPSSPQLNGVQFNSQGAVPNKLTFNKCSFGVGATHSTADVNISAIQSGMISFNNCILSSSLEITATAYNFLTETAYIGIQRNDQTVGNHRAFIRYGIITRDTAIYRTASPSMRIEPESSTYLVNTKIRPFRVAVNSGQTCTPSVYVRESVLGDGVAYNGVRIKLYQKANYNLGVESDVLLATATAASTGAWELLTGTTAAATDDGVFEFYLEFNGTAGWINIDDFTATVA